MADGGATDGVSVPRGGSGGVGRVALVLQGFDVGGGIPATARWLRDGLHATGGYEVDILDLAVSRSDASSRRIVRPASWFRSSLRVRGDDRVDHWGANAVEIEPMRYRPRAELTRVLNEYDIVQIVAGAPALAVAARRAKPPVMLLTATLVAWEREAQLAAWSGHIRWWRRAMTHINVRMENRAIARVDHIFVINNYTGEHLRERGHVNVSFAPPGVDTDLFTPHPAGWQGAGPLLSVCRLGDSRKRLDRTVNAYSILVAMGGKVPDLVLAGKGELSRDVTEVITKSGLSDRIHVTSDVPITELPDLMRKASVFLQSSQEEGLGLSVVEAMACGLPVVATETAGSRETVDDGVTGWLVPQTPEEKIAATMARRIRELLDGQGAEMAQRGRSRSVALFSNHVAIARITDIYQALKRA